MDISATLIGQTVVAFAFIIGLLCYFIARTKTRAPVATAIGGAVVSLIPPLGFIYLLVLVAKKEPAYAV